MTSLRATTRTGVASTPTTSWCCGPIFAEGSLRWFAGTLIHVADMGGSAVAGLGALASDTYAEGVLLPPVRLYRAGEANRDVLGIIARNSRSPSKVMGDLHGLSPGSTCVARRMEELVDRYGADALSLADRLVPRLRRAALSRGDQTDPGRHLPRQLHHRHRRANRWPHVRRGGRSRPSVTVT